jgi:cholesterol transport system auxiliary component
MNKNPSISALASIILAFTLLTACSLVNRPEPVTLIAPRAPVPELPLFETTLPVQLSVATPDAANSLKNDRIALLFDEREIKFLAEAKWEAPVQVLLQRQLIRYLDATKAFSAVGSDSLGMQSKYRLHSDVQRLHLCYATGENAPTAEIRLSLSVLDITRGKILGNRTINFKDKAQGGKQDQLLDALDGVVYRAMLDAARWTASLVKDQESRSLPQP